MRGKTAKLIRKFTRESWDRTPEEQRTKSLKNFRKNAKREWNRNVKFREFVTTLTNQL